MAEKIKNVFISHVHEDDAGLADLKKLIEKGGLTVRDSSINSSNPNDAKNPDYVKSQILAPQINWASTLLVYITPKTKESPWVNWEIEYAAKLETPKRIVGIYAQGARDCDVPEALEKYADDVRGWQSEGIVDAILGKTNDWRGPSGGLRDPRPIKRQNC
jgi:Thoeris protein ThsB, TIR-like domain